MIDTDLLKFPEEKVQKLMAHYKEILALLGEDTGREGLLKTPERVAKAMLTLTRGYDVDPKEILLGAKFKEEYSQMVVVKDIDFFSMCEGAHDLANQRMHSGNAAPIRRNGRSRSQTHVHADAGRGEAELHHHHFRLYRSFQSSQDKRGIHEPDSEISHPLSVTSGMPVCVAIRSSVSLPCKG